MPKKFYESDGPISERIEATGLKKHRPRMGVVEVVDVVWQGVGGTGGRWWIPIRPDAQSCQLS
jgi:hypothetical protein